MKKLNEMKDVIDYYIKEGAPGDQMVLLEFLREAQVLQGGALDGESVSWIAEKLRVKEAFLRAVISKMPTLRLKETNHRLEVCGSCKASAEIRKYIEETYGVKSGGSSEKGGFTYQVTGCLKNCKHGPAVKWDGEMMEKASVEEIKKLIQHA